MFKEDLPMKYFDLFLKKRAASNFEAALFLPFKMKPYCEIILSVLYCSPILNLTK